MAAVVIVLLAGAVIMTAVVLGARACLYAVRRRVQRRSWDDLVIRHQELDRELDRIWRRR